MTNPTYPGIDTPTDDAFNQHSDTATEVVDAVVPDHMPEHEVAVRTGEVVSKKDATDQFGRNLYDADGGEEWYFDDKTWPHQFVDFRGDKLAVRRPTQQALSAFSLATSKHVKVRSQNNLTGLFIERHLSEATYDRVYSRMMDGDDPAYDKKAIGKLIGMVVKLHTSPGEIPVESPDIDDE